MSYLLPWSWVAPSLVSPQPQTFEQAGHPLPQPQTLEQAGLYRFSTMSRGRELILTKRIIIQHNDGNYVKEQPLFVEI